MNQPDHQRLPLVSPMDGITTHAGQDVCTAVSDVPGVVDLQLES